MTVPVAPAAEVAAHRPNSLLRALGYDKSALAAVAVLLVVALLATVGPLIFSGQGGAINLLGRNAPPLSFQFGWEFILGADSLGRSLLARIAVGASTTLTIACSAVLASLVVGGTLGLIAGYARPAIGQAIMRLTDVVMSFPSLLLALVVLYLLGSSVVNVVIVLAITRIPVYLRTARAEVLEIKQRTFVIAAQTLGARSGRIVFRHMLPLVVPTLLTIASIDFAAVVLAESALSFLGFGVQLPEFTWGSMVANGQAYLGSAWWVSFFPGLAILLTTLSLNVVGNWLRLATDPHQRWRFTGGHDGKA